MDRPALARGLVFTALVCGCASPARQAEPEADRPAVVVANVPPDPDPVLF